MEGKVFTCIWEKKNGKFELSTTRPRILIASADFNEASKKLLIQLGRKTGDFEAQLRFDPPAPESSDGHYISSPDFLVIGHNEGVHPTSLTKNLFAKGFCSRCRNFIGERTEEAIAVKSIPSSAVASINKIYPTPTIISEKFLNLFAKNDVKRLKVQKVQLPVRSKTKFYEVVGKSVIRPVLSRKMDITTSVCSKCKKSWKTGSFANSDVSVFIVASEAKKLRQPISVIGWDNKKVKILVAKSYWDKIKKNRGTKGILISPLGLIPIKDAIKLDE